MHRRFAIGFLTSFLVLAACETGDTVQLLLDEPGNLCVGQSGTVTVTHRSPGDAPAVTELEVTGAELPVTPSATLVPSGEAQLEVSCEEPGTFSFAVVPFFERGGERVEDSSLRASVTCAPCDDAGLDAGADASIADAGFSDAEPTDGQVPPTVATGTFASIPGTEVVLPYFVADLFGLTGPIAMVGGEGVGIHDLSDGSIAHDLTEAGARVYRVLAVLSRIGGELRQSIFGVGNQGFFDRGYNEETGSFGFAFLGAIGQNVTHALQIFSATEPEVTEGFVIVNNSLGEVTELAADGLTPNTLVSSADLGVAGVNGSPVSCDANADASRLVCNTDTDLFYWDSGGVQLVSAALGTALRLMRCNAGICALPDFAAGEVVVFRWDLSGPPSVTELARLPIVGAVSAGVRGDGMIVAPSSTTNTLHVVELDGSLTVQSDRTCAIDASGAAPFHARWVGDTDTAVTDQNSDGEITVVDTTTCM